MRFRLLSGCIGPGRRFGTLSALPFTLALPLLAALVGPVGSAEAPVVGVRSPGGRVQIELLSGGAGDATKGPAYRVTFKGQPIILPSRLGADLADDPSLGGPCTVESVQTRSIHTAYTQFPGKRRHVVDNCTEAVVTLRERTGPGRRWEVVLRAYDDGAAFRYRFPAQDGWPRLVLGGERTEFAFPDDARAFALPLNSFTTPYEKRYQRKPVAAIPGDWLLGLPLLVECPGRGWAAVTEANLTDYAGLYLAHADTRGAVLAGRLSPLPREPKVAVRAELPHDSPWRVVLLGEEPRRLIESDLVLNLNEPCALADTSWIHTGKTTFPWWNGYHLEGVPFKPGLNTTTMKHYIDFCAEAGIPYHSLDGLDNVAWYGGPIVPYKGADIIQGLPGLDLPEVIRYARSKGVRLRLWMNWQAARDHMDRAFPLYRKWGIEGVMIDFIERDDQEMVNWERKLLRLAADNHLTVTLHNVAKPTGLERTYPNLLTSESVLNLEYDKWDPLGCSPEHMLTVPFTRMLAGPLDFHQGSFRGVPVAKFRPRNEAPHVMGTPCFALATYVVYQDHLPMVADYPAAYRGHPALKMLVQVPTTWDDTRAVAGSVGEYAVIARRHGADWYVGAMNAGRPRSLRVPLTFLGPGRYRAEIYADDAAAPHRMSRRTEEVTAATVLEPRLEADGGYFVWLTPLAEKGPGTAKEVSTMKPEQASAFARLALKGVRREYPNHPGDVLNDEADLWPVHVRHPAFYGSFDWHSSVHGHWMLVRLLRLFPHLPENKEIRSLLAAHLTAQNLQQEMDSFIRQNSQSFERPYGWAWLLKLAEELHGWDDPDGREWSKNLKPLANLIVERYLAFFPKQTYPIRSGVHPNTAFGLAFALDYAGAVGDERLRQLVEERSRTYFGHDTGIPAAWEPDGADFFSPSLVEADLMRRVLPPAEFQAWFRRFLPDVAKGEPRTLLTPAQVTDRRDPQLVHLDGLNLSRAWCMRGIAAALSKDDPARKVLAEAAARHAEAALPHVASGDYAGEHWLASFAVYLLSTPSPD